MEREVGERLSGKLSPVFIDLVKYFMFHTKNLIISFSQFFRSLVSLAREVAKL